jgi:RHS repeat-associated protein
MSLAVKHLDPVLGIDIHLIITPAGVVVPIPHPHVGIIFDPFDYIPLIGATVIINGLPRAHAGTAGIALPPHFPMGGVFVKLPANEHEVFMGSSTVIVDEEPFTYMGLPVLSCQDIGMPSPPRKRGPGAKSLLLPTSTVLSIPTGAPVLIGGPPTISMAGMATRLAAGALTKGFKKLRGLQKGSRKMKAVSERLHKAADEVMDKLGVGKRARDRVHKSICTLTGHPVDVATGRVVTEALDWELPGPIPLKFERHYSSSLSWRDSVLGHGWSHSLDLAVWEEEGKVVYRAEDGREIEFDMGHLPKRRMPIGASVYEPVNRLTLRRTGELGWEVETAEGLVHSLRAIAEQHQGVCRVVRTSTYAAFEILYEYSERGLLEWVVDSAGRRLRFEHDEWGRLVKVWLPHSTQPGLVPYTRYMYSETGDLVKVYDALGHATRYEYESHLLNRETDRTGLSFYFEYEGKGPEAWCVRTWGDGGIHDHCLTYDREGGRTGVTNSLGHTKVYYWDGRGVVLKEVDPLGNVWCKEYDQHLRLVEEVDPLGNTTRYGHDERGNCTRVTGPDGATWEYRYNHLNQPEWMRDPLGGEWEWSYNPSAQLVEERNPLGERRRHDYSQGLLVGMVDARGRRTELAYDEHKNLAWVRAPEGETLRLSHDRRGRLIYRRDPRGAEWRSQYNELGWEIRWVEPTGETWGKKYDPEGNVVELRGPRRRVLLSYEGFHWLASREEAGTRVGLKHDLEGRLVEVVNEAGEAYRWVLDPCSRIQQETGFDGATRHYQYDAAGRLSQVVYASGRRAGVTYDGAGRLVEVKFSDGTYLRYGYRLDGALVWAENESGKVVLERDGLGRLVREEQKWGWVASQYEQDRERVGLESSLESRQRFTRDALGRVRALRYDSPRERESWQVLFERDGVGLERERKLPGGVVSRWRHDAARRPLEQETRVGNMEQVRRLYQWREEDQLAALVDTHRGETRFEHDLRGRLVGALLADGTRQYRAMDEVGNLYRQPDRRDRKYGRGGRLLEVEGVRCTYDLDGYLTEVDSQNGRWRYRWKGSGLLQEVERPDGARVTFEYDALARRTCKRVTAVQGQRPREVRFLWDGHVPLHEIASSGDTNTWIFEPESFTPLGKEDKTGRYSVVTDHLGTPTEMYDDLGRLAWRIQLDTFGVGKTDVARQHCPWRWPGQYEDDEAGLHYNRFRYYAPYFGCYLSQDPLGLAGGLNHYQYADDPVVLVDPLGLACSRHPPRIEDGNLKEGWSHIEARHISGNHPDGPGDLFASCVTRDELQGAARRIVQKGTRVSDPRRRIQTLEKRVKVAGRRERVRLIVDSEDSNRVITMFPVRGG